MEVICWIIFWQQNTHTSTIASRSSFTSASVVEWKMSIPKRLARYGQTTLSSVSTGRIQTQGWTLSPWTWQLQQARKNWQTCRAWSELLCFSPKLATEQLHSGCLDHIEAPVVTTSVDPLGVLHALSSLLSHGDSGSVLDWIFSHQASKPAICSLHMSMKLLPQDLVPRIIVLIALQLAKRSSISRDQFSENAIDVSSHQNHKTL